MSANYTYFLFFLMCGYFGSSLAGDPDSVYGDDYSWPSFNYLNGYSIPPGNGAVNMDLSARAYGYPGTQVRPPAPVLTPPLSASWSQGTPNNITPGFNDTLQFSYYSPSSSQARADSQKLPQQQGQFKLHDQSAKLNAVYSQHQMGSSAQAHFVSKKTAGQGPSRKRLRKQYADGVDSSAEFWHCPKCFIKIPSNSEQVDWHSRSCNFRPILKNGDTVSAWTIPTDLGTNEFIQQPFSQPEPEPDYPQAPLYAYGASASSGAPAQGMEQRFPSLSQTYIGEQCFSDGQYADSNASTSAVGSHYETSLFQADTIGQHQAQTSNSSFNEGSLRESNGQSVPSSLSFSPENNSQSRESVQTSTTQSIPVRLVCTYRETDTADGAPKSCLLSFISEQELRKHVVDYHLHTCHCFEWRDNKRQKCFEGPFANAAALKKHVYTRHLEKALPDKN